MEDRHGQDGNLLKMSHRRKCEHDSLGLISTGYYDCILYHLVNPYVTYNDVYVRRFLCGVEVS